MSGGGVLASMPPADEISIGCMGTLDFQSQLREGITTVCAMDG